MNEIAATPLASGAEGSVFAMFWSASIVVKMVMIGLLAASVWCWAIIINKTLLFRRTRAAMDRIRDGVLVREARWKTFIIRCPRARRSPPPRCSSRR